MLLLFTSFAIGLGRAFELHKKSMKFRVPKEKKYSVTWKHKYNQGKFKLRQPQNSLGHEPRRMDVAMQFARGFFHFKVPNSHVTEYEICIIILEPCYF